MNNLYTKTVLSIIAAALLALVAQNAIHQSQAQSSAPQKVQICDAAGLHCANLRSFEYASYYGLAVAATVKL